MKNKNGAKNGAAHKNGRSVKNGGYAKTGISVKNAISLKNAKPSANGQAKPSANGHGKTFANGNGKPSASVKTAVALLAEQANYRPSEKEPFMDERQREYFRLKLLSWRDDILREARETLQHLQDENQNHPDLADRASSETDRAIELRARDRQRKLIAKIDAAIARIDDGSYGFCEETGEPIALKRLEARPIATLSVEAQERHERRERVYRDD
jgi:DnaK suppressor protein